jgi:propanol-preferring alcohol dehydrogenase
VLEEIATPRPAAGEILVKVGGAGFCHSDLHLIDGEIRILPRFPITLGHENAGVVAAVGTGVRAVREGDRVVVYGGWGCGRCDCCVGGNEQLCAIPEWAGLSQRDGGYAEYMLVPHERYLIKLGRLATREAAPLADAALTPYRAIKKALPFLDPDYPALLIGVGGLGQYAVTLLRELSGCAVIAVDVSESKRRLASNLGAAYVLDGKDPEIGSKVMDLTQGRGVAAAFDFVGNDATLALAIGSTRTLGKVTQVGLGGGNARIHVLENSRFEVQFEVTLWGNIRELREVVALAEGGRLHPIPLEFAPLDHINDVYTRLKRGEIDGRAVIVP